jgi:hypothetical protein
MAAIASADLIVDMEQTVRARPARSIRMFTDIADRRSVIQGDGDARLAEAR